MERGGAVDCKAILISESKISRLQDVCNNVTLREEGKRDSLGT